MREADFLARELAHVDREIARYAVTNPDTRRLMTIPGIDVTTAATLMLRQLELAAGAPKRANPRGSRGPATPDVPAQ